MKKLFKEILPPKVWCTLKTFKERLVDINRKMIVAFINILPNGFRVKLKSSIKVIRSLDYDKCDIYLNIDSHVELKTRARSCEKEPDLIKWIEGAFKEGEVFYDIGANIGAYSLIAAKYYQGKVKVYSFEPAFFNYDKLCRNIYLNNCQESITALPIALTDKTGIEIFNYSNLESGTALHSLGKAIDYKGNEFAPLFKQSITALTLDDIIRIFKIPSPNHIKIDVDGAEEQIIKGAENTLRNRDLKTILIEVSQEQTGSDLIIKLIESKGFKIGSRRQCVADLSGGPAIQVFNYLFIR